MDASFIEQDSDAGPSSPRLLRCRWDFCTEACETEAELSFHFIKAHMRWMQKELLPGQKRRRLDDGTWEKVGEPSRLADQIPIPNPTPTSGGDITTTTHTTDTSLFPPPASLPPLPATFPSAAPDFRPPASPDGLPPPPATIDFSTFLHSNPSSPDMPTDSVLPSSLPARPTGPALDDFQDDQAAPPARVGTASAPRSGPESASGSMPPPPAGQKKRQRSPDTFEEYPISSSPFLPPTQAPPTQSSVSAIPSSPDPTEQPVSLPVDTPIPSDGASDAVPDTRQRANSTASSSGPPSQTLAFGALLRKASGQTEQDQKRKSVVSHSVGFSWGMK